MKKLLILFLFASCNMPQPNPKPIHQGIDTIIIHKDTTRHRPIITHQVEQESQCGEERWSIKTLTDKDTGLIDFSYIITATVHDQIRLPINIPIDRDLPRQPLEKYVYQIDCYIIGFKREEDRDIHIVLQDLNTNETMIAEIPSPDCQEIKKSSHYSRYSA